MVIRSLIATLLLLITTHALQAQSGASTFEFVENKGQFDKAVKFKGQLPSGDFYLHGNGFTIVLHNQEELARLMRHQHGLEDNHGSAQRSGKAPKQKNEKNAQPGGPGENKFELHSHAYRVQFLGGNENAQLAPDKVVNTYNNYIIGNDRSKWVKRAKIYQAVTYKNVYPNIDVRYYSESGTLKYDIIVHPGGDVSKVALRYEGADKLELKRNELIVKTSVGDVKELYPYTYQFDNIKGRTEIKCSYVLDRDNTVRFRLDNYDRNATLIIDPTLIFSTYTRSTGNNWGFTATPGPDGSLFAGGIVFSAGFPVNPGAYQEVKAGLNDIVDIGIIKFTPDGTGRTYATYIGGTSDDLPHSLVADGAGNLVILGRTYSSDYPKTVPVEGGGGNCDIIVTKLNAAGDDLIGSMIIGGDLNDGVNVEDQYITKNDRAISLLKNYGDDSHSEVILDGAGNIYVAAQTQSAGNFPIRGAVFQPAPRANQEGVVMKINPNCNAIIWSSFLGGDRDDAAFVLALEPNTNNIYVAGGTYSDNLLPAAIPGVIDNTHNGLADGYVAVISNDGSTLITGTYLGTANDDIVYGIHFDRNGFPYVMGVSRGSWPVINAAYSNPGSKQFVSKLEPDLSAYVYSTVFGNGNALPSISPVAFLVDRCENVYVSGWGGWILPNDPTDPYNLSNTVGMPTTADALKRTTDGRDFYFIVLKKDATELLYGSFFGQTGSMGEHVDGGTSRFDESGVIYMAICANCFASQPPPITQPFPITPGAFGPFNGTGDGGCNLAAVKIAFNFSGVGSGPKPFIGGVQDTVGCIPFNITFRDTVRNARRYIWNFGDGSPEVESTNFEITHTYTAIGSYTIRLIGIDSTTCNIRDTAYTTIYARDDQALLAMDVDRQEPCEALSYLFRNISTAPAGEPFTNNSFIWDFGDGTRVPSGLGDVTHAYANPGPYTVRLIMVDTNYCNSPDSIPFNLTVAEQVRAQIEDVDPGCVPYTVQFDNSSLAGQTYRWEFDDGTISTEMNPVHTFNDVRSYTVKLVVTDSTTCNIIDSTTTTVIVNPLPQAAFTATPVPPVENTPTVFHNFSINGIRHKWLFGDGDSTIKTTMDTVMHQYDSTGIYNACLITYNQFDCPDTVCHDVQALVRPLMDVPNAFTPGRGGQNSVVVVAGFGIGRMTWRIYNRWGQLVFESNNRKRGWDGTYKGVLQPMDVYAYTLDVEFTDGTKARKTGDITLIR